MNLVWRSASTYSCPVNGARRGSAVTALVWPRAAIASIRRPTPPTPRSGWSRGVLAHSLAATRSASWEPAENTLRSPAHHSAVASWCSKRPERRAVVVAHRQQPGHVEPRRGERPCRGGQQPRYDGEAVGLVAVDPPALGLPVLVEPAARDPLESAGVAARGVDDSTRQDREEPLELQPALVVRVVSGGHHGVDRPAGEWPAAKGVDPSNECRGAVGTEKLLRSMPGPAAAIQVLEPERVLHIGDVQVRQLYDGSEPGPESGTPVARRRKVASSARSAGGSDPQLPVARRRGRHDGRLEGRPVDSQRRAGILLTQQPRGNQGPDRDRAALDDLPTGQNAHVPQCFHATLGNW